MTDNPAGPTPVALPRIAIREVSKRFGRASDGAHSAGGDAVAVNDVSLDIRAGEFFSLLGPSGCGKTTLLRLIAGFEIPSAGKILLDGIDVTSHPPNRRPTNLVFQHYALFPHLDVRRNVAFGLRYQKVRGTEANRRVTAALERVRMTGFDNRLPSELSGGQRQRVALARALVLEPSVLLLDEPLGALDQKLRREMQIELKQIQRSLGMTFVFVTHDQEEALVMSDRIGVMNRGRLEQVGAADDVFERPRTRFVAEFMGADNFFDAGDRVFVVRPERLRLLDASTAPSDASTQCRPVTIADRIYQGATQLCRAMDASGQAFTVVMRAGERSWAAGERALLSWSKSDAVSIERS